jgi:hypothetical protein
MNKKNLMENDEAEAEPVNRSGGAAAGLWKRDDPGLVGLNIPPFVKLVRSAVNHGSQCLRFGPFALRMEELLGSNPSVGRTLIDDQGIRQGPNVVVGSSSQGRND